MRNTRSNPGKRLRARRLALGLSLRDVHRASISIARKLRNRAFIASPSRLHDFETKSVVPSIYRIYTLALVYKCELRELLRRYGIPSR